MLTYLSLPRSGFAPNVAPKTIPTQLSAPSAPDDKIWASASDGIALCAGSSIMKNKRSCSDDISAKVGSDRVAVWSTTETKKYEARA